MAFQKKFCRNQCTHNKHSTKTCSNEKCSHKKSRQKPASFESIVRAYLASSSSAGRGRPTQDNSAWYERYNTRTSDERSRSRHEDDRTVDPWPMLDDQPSDTFWDQWNHGYGPLPYLKLFFRLGDRINYIK